MLFLVREKRGLQILSEFFFPGSAAFEASCGVSLFAVLMTCLSAMVY